MMDFSRSTIVVIETSFFVVDISSSASPVRCIESLSDAGRENESLEVDLDIHEPLRLEDEDCQRKETQISKAKISVSMYCMGTVMCTL